jgi:hypothetical protein
MKLTNGAPLKYRGDRPLCDGWNSRDGKPTFTPSSRRRARDREARPGEEFVPAIYELGSRRVRVGPMPPTKAELPLRGGDPWLGGRPPDPEGGFPRGGRFRRSRCFIASSSCSRCPFSCERISPMSSAITLRFYIRCRAGEGKPGKALCARSRVIPRVVSVRSFFDESDYGSSRAP